MHAVLKRYLISDIFQQTIQSDYQNADAAHDNVCSDLKVHQLQ